MAQQQDARDVRQGHPYFMYDAIMRQPAAMEDMLVKHANTVQPVAAELARKRRVYLVGIGTSWHAGLVAGHWFPQVRRGVAGRLSRCAIPLSSAPTRRLWNGDDGVIVISHRGTKTYSFLALEMAKSSGAYTVAVTSTDPVPRIAVADTQLQTVGQERSAAFTISYTAGLTVMGMLAAAMGGWTDQSGPTSDQSPAQLRARLDEIPAAAEQVLARQARFSGRRGGSRAASGSSAPDGGRIRRRPTKWPLKIKETSACDSEGLQIEQLLHGPFCSVDEKCLVTLVAPPGPGYERAMNVSRAANAVGAPVWGLLQEGDALLSGLATDQFTLPPFLSSGVR